MHSRVMRLSAPLGLADAFVMVAAGIAVASVSFDPATGTGYVDKTDVQAAFGWKEGTFQANARRLGFHAATFTAWTWECVISGESVTVTADLESSWVVASEMVSTRSGTIRVSRESRAAVTVISDRSVPGSSVKSTTIGAGASGTTMDRTDSEKPAERTDRTYVPGARSAKR